MFLWTSNLLLVYKKESMGMSEVRKILSEETMLAECRAAFDFMQRNAKDIAEAGISIEAQQKGLSALRDTITRWRAKHPHVQEVHKQVLDTKVYAVVSQIQSALNQGNPMPTHEIEKLRDLLEYVQRYVKNYDDMFTPQPVPYEKFRAEKLAAEQAKSPHSMFTVPFDEEKCWKEYHKYVKTFKKEAAK